MSDTQQMRYDLETAARALRGSSWPGEMAQRMEEAAARIDSYADRIEELESRPCPHVVEGDEGTNHCALAEANVTRARAERDQALAGAYGDIEAIEEVMHRDADDWVASHPTEALIALEKAGVLAKCYAVPESPHTARGRFSWGLFANPGDRGEEDVVELWERVDEVWTS